MISGHEQEGENRRAISWRSYQVGEDLLDALGILDADLNIVQLSRRGWDLIGLRHKEGEPVFFCEVIHPEDRGYIQASLEHCMSGSGSLDIEIRLNQINGQQKWAHLRAVPMSERHLLFVTIYNISSYKTEIKQLSHFFTMSPDLFCVVDFEGRFVRVNSAWENLLGWPLKTLMENGFSSFVHPLDRERTEAQYSNNIAGADTVIFENRYRTIDGTYKWIEWRSVTLAEEKLIFANARDITARKEFEVKLREMEVAQISDRTKSMFLSAMSHELRTPLNGILGAANIAYDDAESDSQKEILKTLKNSAESLAKIVEDILDFSKIDAGQIDLDLHPFSIRGLMVEIRRLNSVAARKKHIELKFDVAELFPDILESDSNRLGQVLRNLIDNAIRFTDEGMVTVSVKAIKNSSEVKVAADQGGGIKSDYCWLRFIVSDTGLGIDEDEADKIFNAFHQAQEFMDRKTGGMGIGLAVSKQLVELMGGTINLTTRLGEGSAFTVDIPFKIPNRRPMNEPQETPQVLPANPMHILVVEDNIINQKVVVRFLTNHGHSVIVADNGRLAIEAFEKEVYDLILMDIQMPEMDGITATHRIRDIEKEGRVRTPVVAMTAHAAKSDENACYDAGMDDFIVKPFKPEKLRRVLAKFSNMNHMRVFSENYQHPPIA